MLRAAALLLASLSLASAGEPSVDDLVGQLTDEDLDTRILAREKLRAKGAEARPALEKLSPGDTPVARQAKTLLRQIAFDEAVKPALAGASWLRWENRGETAWIRIEVRETPKGYSIREVLSKGDVKLDQTAETDRDLVVSSLRATLAGPREKKEVAATFDGEVCKFTDDGKEHDWPAPGPAYTDWSLVLFASALAANPPHETDIVVWDSIDSEPATTKIHFEESRAGDGPLNGEQGLPIRVEGLLTSWMKPDGTFSHASRGEGSLVVRVAEKDVPKDVVEKK